jgi:hypothetical protein
LARLKKRRSDSRHKQKRNELAKKALAAEEWGRA